MTIYVVFLMVGVQFMTIYMWCSLWNFEDVVGEENYNVPYEFFEDVVGEEIKIHLNYLEFGGKSFDNLTGNRLVSGKLN